MRSTSIGRRIGGVALASMIALAAFAAQAAKSPTKASVDCRKRIADQAKSSLAKSFAKLDACHRDRDKGKRADDCNALGLVAGALQTKVQETCIAGDPVLANYGDADAAGQVVTALEEALGASAHALQDAPPLTNDAVAAKCAAAIGKARTKLVKDVVARSIACQKALDKSATTFGPLAATCAGGPSDKVGASAAKSIEKACRRKLPDKTFAPITGVEVGSCDPLPGCVVGSATATGKVAAAAIYKAPLVCGDGVVDPGEQCDPGADVAGDCCSAACGFVAANVVCRAPAGVCDLAETCSGTSALCPLDQKSTDPCQTTADPCAPPSTCDGVGDTCPSLAQALAARQRAGAPFARSFLSRVFYAKRPLDPTKPSVVIGGALKKGPKPAPPSAGNGPTLALLRSKSVVAGGGRQFGLFTKSATNAKATSAPAAAQDKFLWVVAGPPDSDCSDVASFRLDTDDVDLEAAFVDDLTTEKWPIQFALGDAEGPTTAYTTVDLQPSGGFFRRVSDIEVGPGSSMPRQLTAVGTGDGAWLFFVADKDNRPRIWRTNGSEKGTTEVYEAPEDTVLRDLTAVGSELYFGVCGTNGDTCAIRRTADVTANAIEARTTLVADDVRTYCGDLDAAVSERVAAGDELYFISDSPRPGDGSDIGCELWKADHSGAVLVSDIRNHDQNGKFDRNGSAPRLLRALSGTSIVFVADDGTGARIWKSDGAADETDPVPGFPEDGLRIDELAVAGSTFFFVLNGNELWKGSDEVSLVTNVFSTVAQLTKVGTRLFFSGCMGANDCELWRVEGNDQPVQVSDLNAGPNGANPSQLVDVDGVVYFAASTTATGRELWRSDGTTSELVADIVEFGGNSLPRNLCAVNGAVVFTADDNLRGRELWQNDGTLGGTDRVRDLAEGSSNATLVPPIVAAGSVAYVAVSDTKAGSELFALKPFIAAPSPAPTPSATATPTPTDGPAAAPTPTLTPVVGNDCCIGHVDPLAPGCESTSCQACVCAFDGYCCGTTWDAYCAAEAAAQCADNCPCAPPTPTPIPTETPVLFSCCFAHAGAGCELRDCATCIGERDPYCVTNQWDSICANEAATIAECRDACAACVPPPPSSTPSPTPTPEPTATLIANSCCAAHDGGGCHVPDCEACICGSDPFCCGQQWDALCASEASGTFPQCASACAVCAPPSTPTPMPTPTPIPTLTPSLTSCCAVHPVPSCDSDECAGCVCGSDPYCCQQAWDDQCVSEASGGFPNCNAACAACVPSPTPTPSPDSCCVEHGSPGCNEAACSACVCFFDPSCCSGSWTAACAVHASGEIIPCHDACQACQPPP